MKKYRATKMPNGGRLPRPTVGGQREKQTRIEQGVYPIPGEYDMTTAAGRKVYSDDRKEARENLQERKANQRTMTPKERLADNQLLGKQSQARTTTGSSPALYVIGGGKGYKGPRINPDLKAAAGQRGSETTKLRPKTEYSVYRPKGPIGSKNR